jgi:hypothetical protein
MQLVSTQQWGHHQAKNTNWRNEMYMEVPYGIPFGLHWLQYIQMVFVELCISK